MIFRSAVRRHSRAAERSGRAGAGDRRVSQLPNGPWPFALGPFMFRPSPHPRGPRCLSLRITPTARLE
jgi:hypothetical protein